MNQTLNEKSNVQLVKMGDGHQVTLPLEVVKRLKLEAGDFFEVQVFDNSIVMAPKRLIPKDQEWFWTEEWQEGEKKADEAIVKGDLIGPFETAREAINALKTTPV